MELPPTKMWEKCPRTSKIEPIYIRYDFLSKVINYSGILGNLQLKAQ
jgi:hypothetical protein